MKCITYEKKIEYTLGCIVNNKKNNNKLKLFYSFNRSKLSFIQKKIASIKLWRVGRLPPPRYHESWLKNMLIYRTFFSWPLISENFWPFSLLGYALTIYPSINVTKKKWIMTYKMSELKWIHNLLYNCCFFLCLDDNFVLFIRAKSVIGKRTENNKISKALKIKWASIRTSKW